jgi:hypothetical protein
MEHASIDRRGGRFISFQLQAAPAAAGPLAPLPLLQQL